MKAISLTDVNNQNLITNRYLQERNKKFFRGHSNFVHPLYELELKNSIESINNFLNITILKYAYFKRLRAIYNLSAQKCFNNFNNNYSFSEAEVCEELMIEKDVILTNLKDYTKEVEARIQDLYEKQVKFVKGNNFKIDGENFSVKQYEANHRRFLLRLNFIYRYYFYFTAQKLFANSY